MKFTFSFHINVHITGRREAHQEEGNGVFVSKKQESWYSKKVAVSSDYMAGLIPSVVSGQEMQMHCVALTEHLVLGGGGGEETSHQCE